jgi:hypothetical protein
MRLPFPFMHAFLAAWVSATLAENASVQTLHGTLVPCEIDVPATWRVLGANKGVIAARGDGMQIMLSSDLRVGDSHVAAQEAYEGARQLMPDAKCSVSQPITLAGHEWLEYTITATVENKAMTFLNYTYSGPEGTFTIIGQIWTDQFNQKRDALIRHMRTFRFSKA